MVLLRRQYVLTTVEKVTTGNRTLEVWFLLETLQWACAFQICKRHLPNMTNFGDMHNFGKKLYEMQLKQMS